MFKDCCVASYEDAKLPLEGMIGLTRLMDLLHLKGAECATLPFCHMLSLYGPNSSKVIGHHKYQNSDWLIK